MYYSGVIWLSPLIISQWKVSSLTQKRKVVEQYYYDWDCIETTKKDKFKLELPSKFI